MNPSSDSAAGSPLATLRQLKEMLDAGTITPQEFEALKQRLIFGTESEAPAGLPAPALSPAPSPAPAGPSAAFGQPGPPGPAPVPTPYLDTPAALTPEATPLLTPEPDWLAAPAALPPAVLADDPADEDLAPEAERRNPLNLVFALGALLLFLGVVAYLTLGRPATPDEHLTSTSQTAADTTAAAPEVGPQAEQLTLPPAAAPETVRVAPATPPPVAAPAALPPASADSAATPPASVPAPVRPATQAAPARPATRPATAPATTPALPADTTTRQ